jgi:uncharacterized membrane protein (DUF106 family)
MREETTTMRTRYRLYVMNQFRPMVAAWYAVIGAFRASRLRRFATTWLS